MIGTGEPGGWPEELVDLVLMVTARAVRTSAKDRDAAARMPDHNPDRILFAVRADVRYYAAVQAPPRIEVGRTREVRVERLGWVRHEREREGEYPTAAQRLVWWLDGIRRQAADVVLVEGRRCWPWGLQYRTERQVRRLRGIGWDARRTYTHPGYGPPVTVAAGEWAPA